MNYFDKISPSPISGERFFVTYILAGSEKEAFENLKEELKEYLASRPSPRPF